MYCNQCGLPLDANQLTCPNCGRSSAPAPVARSAGGGSVRAWDGRVARHRKLLGALWIIRGVLLLPGGLFLWLGLSRAAMFAPRVALGPGAFWSAHMMPPIFAALGVGMLGMGVLSVLAGIALLQPQSWARILTIVLGILDLVSIPFGTALGIYTLWVLLPEPSEAEFRTLAQAHAGGVR